MVTEWTCDVCGKTESEKLSNWRVVACGPVTSSPPDITDPALAAAMATPSESSSAVACSKPCRTKWLNAL